MRAWILDNYIVWSEHFWKKHMDIYDGRLRDVSEGWMILE